MQERSKKTPAKEIHTVVSMSALSSAEHVVWKDDAPRRVLSNIYLRIGRKQVWGMTARTGYEILLLLEIMGNIRPYFGGKCVLVERGMMRKKRVIQKHVFYIGDANMLYGNMNVLEFLMFATANMRGDRLVMQEELFELLIDIGLGDISLSTVKWLTADEKAAVALIAAAYSDSMMVILNMPEVTFDGIQDAVAKTAKLIVQRGKTLVIGTKNCGLIQDACDHTAFIADGRIIYQGTTDHLRQRFDKAAVIIDDPDISGIKKKLASSLVGCVLVEKEGSLFVKTSDIAMSPRRIYQNILDTQVVPCCMIVNEKTVSNAYEELMLRNDLSKQLF